MLLSVYLISPFSSFFVFLPEGLAPTSQKQQVSVTFVYPCLLRCHPSLPPATCLFSPLWGEHFSLREDKQSCQASVRLVVHQQGLWISIRLSGFFGSSARFVHYVRKLWGCFSGACGVECLNPLGERLECQADYCQLRAVDAVHGAGSYSAFSSCTVFIFTPLFLSCLAINPLLFHSHFHHSTFSLSPATYPFFLNPFQLLSSFSFGLIHSGRSIFDSKHKNSIMPVALCV